MHLYRPPTCGRIVEMDERRSRFQFQFSLRTLLIVMTACAIALPMIPIAIASYKEWRRNQEWSEVGGAIRTCSSHIHLLLLLLMAITVGASAGWVTNKLRSGNRVKFIVPRGFTGTISVTKNSERGQDLELLDGWYVFRVPPDRKLLVNDTSIFNRWHEDWCRDEEGHPVNLVENCDPAYGVGEKILRWKTN